MSASGLASAAARLMRPAAPSLLALLIGAGPAWAAEERPTFHALPVAHLQAMDKVTARIWPLHVPVGQGVRFGTLDIEVANCVKRPPEEPPESGVFLTISDQLQSGDEIQVFHGWMFASSPALSALEHAVYDVWLVDCVDR